MQRPSMSVNYLEETETETSGAVTPSWFSRLFKIVRQAVADLWALLWTSPLALLFGRSSNFRAEDGSPVARFARGLGYRLAFMPFLLTAIAIAVVWVGTHPFGVKPASDPLTAGLHFETIAIPGSMGSSTEAWLVPVLDARRVLIQKERIFRDRYPAVVLMHDFGANREQLVPLIRPLHDMGLVVLALATRGDDSFKNRGSTFGLHEAEDLSAAVAMLRGRSLVDPARVGVLGIGTGAIACAAAAERDPTIRSLVLAAPPTHADDVLRMHVVPDRWYLSWMAPLYKWSFEIGYGVDADAMDLARFDGMLKNRHGALIIAPTPDLDRKLVDEAVPFLAGTLAEPIEELPTGVSDTR